MKTITDAVKRHLREKFDAACNAYLCELLNLWELDAHYGYWNSDRPGTIYHYGETHNLSSDIIESTFGVFKQKKSPNHLYGVTPFVLFIPAHAAIVGMHDTKSVDFMRIFSDYHNKDIDEWKVQNLKENWVRTRTKTLAKVG